MVAELEYILANRQSARSSSPQEAKRVIMPQNDYDANLQLQQIVEEQERYKQIIINGKASGGRFKSAMRLQTSSKKGPLSISRNMKSVKSNYKPSEIDHGKS